MLVDAAQTTHAKVIAELMEHSCRGTVAAQSREPSPRRLLGQLSNEQVQGMGGGQQREQMRAPELRRAQSVAATAGALARTELSNEVIRHIGIEAFEQRARADHRQL